MADEPVPAEIDIPLVGSRPATNDVARGIVQGGR